jgi:hypothetical protein
VQIIRFKPVGSEVPDPFLAVTTVRRLKVSAGNGTSDLLFGHRHLRYVGMQQILQENQRRGNSTPEPDPVMFAGVSLNTVTCKKSERQPIGLFLIKSSRKIARERDRLASSDAAPLLPAKLRRTVVKNQEGSGMCRSLLLYM